jgi:hypothetical protein
MCFTPREEVLQVPFKYRTGEEVMAGDRVRLSNETGVIEFVADPAVNEPKTAWYVQEYGGGVMISQLESLGSVFDNNPEEDEDLEFVCRENNNGPDEGTAGCPRSEE